MKYFIPLTMLIALLVWQTTLCADENAAAQAPDESIAGAATETLTVADEDGEEEDEAETEDDADDDDGDDDEEEGDDDGDDEEEDDDEDGDDDDEDGDDEDEDDEDEGQWRAGRRGPPPFAGRNREQMMDRMQELRKLQETNPEEFREQVMRMRERMMQQGRDSAGPRGPGRGPGPGLEGRGPRMGRGGPAAEARRGGGPDARRSADARGPRERGNRAGRADAGARRPGPGAPPWAQRGGPPQRGPQAAPFGRGGPAFAGPPVNEMRELREQLELLRKAVEELTEVVKDAHHE